MKKAYRFNLIGIRELDLSNHIPRSIDERFRELSQQKNLDEEQCKVQGHYSFAYEWNLEQEYFGVIVKFAYSVTIDEVLTECFKYTGLIQYRVKDLGGYMDIRTTHDFDMDEMLETTLMSIAISTCRGIIYEKTKGTLFNNLFIPLVDPKSVLVSKKKPVK